jgi:hypothetical protein
MASSTCKGFQIKKPINLKICIEIKIPITYNFVRDVDKFVRYVSYSFVMWMYLIL